MKTCRIRRNMKKGTPDIPLSGFIFSKPFSCCLHSFNLYNERQIKKDKSVSRSKSCTAVSLMSSFQKHTARGHVHQTAAVFAELDSCCQRGSASCILCRQINKLKNTTLIYISRHMHSSLCWAVSNRWWKRGTRWCKQNISGEYINRILWNVC